MGNNAKSLFCSEFIELSHLVIDNEASQEEMERFMSFVNSCQKCAEYFDSEKSALAFIKCNTLKTNTPETLADEIRTKIFHFA